MICELMPVAAAGILAGAAVNLLADALPHQAPLGKPTYPDGTARPLSAWLGISAFALKRRSPPAQPNTAPQQLGWRHPLTELATSALMVLAYLIMGAAEVPAGQLLIWLTYMPILMLTAVIDLEHRRIKRACLLPAAALALLDAALYPQPLPTVPSALAGGALGFAVFFLVHRGGFLFTRLMSRWRRERIQTVAFGFGDVLLMTVSGLMLGLPDLLLAMCLALFLGAGGALLHLGSRFAATGTYRPFAVLPYGPYIIAATLTVLFFAPELWPLLG